MAAKKKIESYDHVLVVEGYRDLLFYAEVLEALGKHEDVFIKELGGKDAFSLKLEDFVTPALLAKKLSLAFMVDGDSDPQKTRQTLESVLSRITSQRVVEGKWTGGTPKIGFMVVPDSDTRGEIETLVWQSWSVDPANSAQRKCVEDYVSCMRSQGVSAHSPDKGLIGALLALKSDEDPRLGPGARTKVFDLQRPELQRLRDFLSVF